LQAATSIPYQWLKGAVSFRLIVPAGFNTDIASTPKPTRLLGFEADGPWRRAAIFHDWLYYWKGDLPPGSYQAFINGEWIDSIARWRRVETDALFKKIMLEDGTPPVKAWIMWAAVRVGGGFNSGDLFW